MSLLGASLTPRPVTILAAQPIGYRSLSSCRRPPASYRGRQPLPQFRTRLFTWPAILCKRYFRSAAASHLLSTKASAPSCRDILLPAHCTYAASVIRNSAPSHDVAFGCATFKCLTSPPERHSSQRCNPAPNVRVECTRNVAAAAPSGASPQT